METDVLSRWHELKAVVESLEYDILKNARGVGAAGVRVRKGLRDLKARAGEIVKCTIVADKEAKAAKHAAKAAKK